MTERKRFDLFKMADVMDDYNRAKQKTIRDDTLACNIYALANQHATLAILWKSLHPSARPHATLRTYWVPWGSPKGTDFVRFESYYGGFEIEDSQSGLFRDGYDTSPTSTLEFCMANFIPADLLVL